MERQSLVEVLSSIKDFRKKRGQRYELLSILSMACAAMLCSYRSYSAIAEWGLHYGDHLCQRLGFSQGRYPCAATFYNLFKGMGVRAFENKLGQWFQSQKELECIALDGKTLRGSRKQGACGSHLLSAVGHHLGITFAQRAVEDKSNEITAILPLLESLFIQGKVLTMDALLTQYEIADAIVQQEADYVMIVKDNQKGLKEEIATFFELEPHRVTSSHQTTEKSHGRIEERQMQTADAKNIHHYWPGAKQIFKIIRKIQRKYNQKGTLEVVYGITSRSSKKAQAPQLMTMTRGHWTIENRSHWVRDVTYDEDRSQVRTKQIPQLMAAFRNMAIGLLRLNGYDNIAQANRLMAAQPQLALNIMGFTTFK